MTEKCPIQQIVDAYADIYETILRGTVFDTGIHTSPLPELSVLEKFLEHVDDYIEMAAAGDRISANDTYEQAELLLGMMGLDMEESVAQADIEDSAERNEGFYDAAGMVVQASILMMFMDAEKEKNLPPEALNYLQVEIMGVLFERGRNDAGLRQIMMQRTMKNLKDPNT